MKAVQDRVVTSVDERRSAIVGIIRGARRSLVLSLFRFKDKEIFGELVRARSRGVTIDVILTARAKGGQHKLEKLHRKLTDIGATVGLYADPVVKYHAKYLVADDGPALVASLNFTKKCLNSTLDALVITHNPDIVSGLRRLMTADRDGQPLPDPLSHRLVLGPERARSQFTALIEGAERRIRLIDAKLSDPDLSALLNAKRAAGVAVEVFKSKHVGGLRSHGKILLIDERVAVVGSLALAALSLDFRREVAIIVEDPAGVADVARLFDAVSSTTPGGPAKRVETKGEALC